MRTAVPTDVSLSGGDRFIIYKAIASPKLSRNDILLKALTSPPNIIRHFTSACLSTLVHKAI